MRKLFSLLTAILFAGSMMAETVTLTMEDYATTEFTVTGSGISVSTAKNDGGSAPVYNATGKDLRVYAKGSITISAEQNITAISFVISTQGKKRLAPLTVNTGSVAVTGTPDFTAEWTGSAQEVTFTVGDKSDYGTDGSTKAGQLDFTAIEITLEGGSVTPPVEMTDAEKLQAYIDLLGDVKTYVSQFAGLGVGAEDFANQIDQLIAYGNLALTSGDATTISAVVAQAEGQINSKINDLLTTGKEGLEKRLDNLLADAEGCETCQAIVNTLKQTVENIAWDDNKSNEENLAALVNQTEQIIKDAQQQIEAALSGGDTPENGEVIFTNADFTGQGTANTGSEVTATKGGVTFTCSKGYSADESLRCYAGASLSITASTTISKIYFATTGGKNGGLDAEVTVNATTYEVASLTSQARFKEIKVVLGEGGGDTPGGDDPVLTDPTNCAEAREAALSVSANNELYNNGKEYTIEGYVTAIQTAYSSEYNNISFWMADAADGGNVLQAYRAACASADKAPGVGDKVKVTGKLTKYNNTPEFDAGCTFEIIEKNAVPAVNLGAKTIAEFLELKNKKDTCVLTGIVANIAMDKNDATQYNKYGNFDLVEIDNSQVSVYVYGLLTADGVAQKFLEMGIDEGDTLTIKAVYSEYNGSAQAQKAVFVEVKKGDGTTPTDKTHPWDEETDFIKTFASYTIDDSDFADYGSLYVEALDDDMNYINLDITLPTGAAGLVPGVYTIKDTYEEPQTVHSGIYDEDYGIIPSYAAVLVEEEGELMIDNIWWIVNGTVTIDDELNITVEATNSLGKIVKVYLTAESGDPTAITNTAIDTKAVKTIENGQLIIEKAGLKYNVMGQQIR